MKEKITKPVNYCGMPVIGVAGNFGRYIRDTLKSGDYIDFTSNDGDELNMTVEQWRAFLADIHEAFLILGVKL